MNNTNQSKSNELLARAKAVMPGGVSSPVRALKAVNGEPLIIERASGAKIWDVDQRSYIDLCMSFGPLILGHASKAVTNAIEEVVGKGTSFGTSSLGEVELAEKIIKFHPSTSWVRFVNSGTEAVMSAIRLARGYTKRNIILKFGGCYHGHADSMLVKAGSGLATFGLSSSAGVPENTSKDTIVISLGDISLVQQAFENHGDEIAAVIIEGVPANNGLLIQSKEFMKELERITHENGSLVILDEVITGFRLGKGGAAEYYEIDPDIVTFGKVIGGGLPVGAYGGRKELMEYISPLGSVYQAGTLSGNPLAMSAGNATLALLNDKAIYEDLERFGNMFEKGCYTIFNELGIPLSIRRIGSIIWLIFQSSVEPINPEDINPEAVEKYNKFHRIAKDEGIYFPPSAFEVAFLSLAHDEQIISELLDKIKTVGQKI
ncbi:MAG: glutamate-1-semialdehyde 2,1-aminomutase [Candidatus Kariarchaeaceae archaeon]